MKKNKILLASLALALTLPLFACAKNTAVAPPINGSTNESVSDENSNATPDLENGTGNSADGSGGSQNNNSGNNSGNGSGGSSAAPETPPAQTAKAQYIRCTGNNVNIRAGAGTDYAVLGQAETGTTYAVVGRTGNWYKTYYKNKTAYIYAEYAAAFTLEKTQNSATEKAIEEGYKLLGVPYVYGAVRLHDGKGNLLGGFTANKFDCSSLVQYMFYKGASVLLNTTTRTQVTQGKYVRPADLQRGDCIYFTNESRQYKTGVEKIGHVAVYLGNGYILHTASDYARIEKMSTARWNFYIEARRFT